MNWPGRLLVCGLALGAFAANTMADGCAALDKMSGEDSMPPMHDNTVTKGSDTPMFMRVDAGSDEGGDR